MLATMVNDHGGESEDHLPRVCLAYNFSEQKSTAFYMMFGRQARMSLDIMYGIYTSVRGKGCQPLHIVLMYIIVEFI